MATKDMIIETVIMLSICWIAYKAVVFALYMI